MYKALIFLTKMSVSREKYEAMREKAKKWKAQVTYDEPLKDEIDELEHQNSELAKTNSMLEKRVKDLEKGLKVSAQSISRKITEAEDRVGRDKLKLETELILKDGEVRRLQATLEDTKDNLKDMKDDNRELRKALRDK